MEIFKVTYLERLFYVNGEIKKYSYPVRTKNPVTVKPIYPCIGYRFYDRVFEINEETSRVEVNNNYTQTIYYGVRPIYIDNDLTEEHEEYCILDLNEKEYPLREGDMTYDELLDTQYFLKKTMKGHNYGRNI